MKRNRSGAAIGLMAAGAVLLAGCGSDNNTPAASGSSGASAAGTSDVQCGGKPTLKASGSSAQANAMTRFVAAYESACSGQTLNYTSNGSGAGVSEFIGNQTDFGGSDSPLSTEKGEYDKAKARCQGADAGTCPSCSVRSRSRTTWRASMGSSSTARPPRRSSTAPSRSGTTRRSRP